jgi:hypothetical protein
LKVRLTRAEKYRGTANERRKAAEAKEAADQSRRESFDALVAEKQAETEDSSEGWKTGYKKAMGAVLVKQGKILSPGATQSPYGCLYDYELTDHVKECGALDVRDIADAEWSEFQDTFTGNSTEYGVQAHVTCNCGKVMGETLEVQGSFGEILNQVLRF